jgi:hypothetical protein
MVNYKLKSGVFITRLGNNQIRLDPTHMMMHHTISPPECVKKISQSNFSRKEHIPDILIKWAKASGLSRAVRYAVWHAIPVSASNLSIKSPKVFLTFLNRVFPNSFRMVSFRGDFDD